MRFITLPSLLYILYICFDLNFLKSKMTEIKPKRLKKRIFRSWITSLVSISLVLIMLSTLGLILVNANRLSEYVREKIGLTLILQDNLKEPEINLLQKKLESDKYVKSIRYIDKETAARELTKELGEDFTGFLGYNPLFASFDVKLFALYTNPDSLKIIEKKFLEHKEIKEVYYQKNLVSVINKNIKKISLIFLILSGLLIFIFIVLINNTIRITIYSQRFSINTMQMVGACNSFIRRPFLKRSLFWGILGAIIANLLVLSSFYTYKKELTGVISITDLIIAGCIFLFTILLGMLISYFSTLFAVNKFLRMKFDELFY